MNVEVVGSPTEIAEESDADVEPKIEKRKREPKKARGVPVPEDTEDEEEFGSPSKRPLRAEDRPLGARELRELLAGHREDMRQAWHAFEHRLDKLEVNQRNQTGEISSLAGRMKINEKDVAGVKKAQASAEKQIENLTSEVASLNVRFQEVQQGLKNTKSEPPPPGAGLGPDPWADYLHRQQATAQTHSRERVHLGEGANSKAASSVVGGGDVDGLSNEDKRTLIVGGWMPDTRRATIEEESKALLEHPEIQPLLDVAKLAVYGPRRSIGMLKFSEREDERSLDDVKSRMWKVVKTASQLKVPVESAKAMGEEKTMWCAFVKTKQARTRTAHISLCRRVTMALAADAKNEEGGVLNFDHTTIGAYDMDWNAGTIWCGTHKLASATHRCPKDAQTIYMTGGWINLDAVGLVAGCSADAARAAFEREL